MLTKSSGRVDAPVELNLEDRVYSGLMRIAKDTTPLRLIVYDIIGYEALRRIDENSWVRMPKRPIWDTPTRLDIDAELLDALAFYVMAGLELQRSKVLMGMYHGEIDSYNDKLTETFLQEATNDSPKFYQFP